MPRHNTNKMANIKNLITNVVAIASVLIGAANAYLQTNAGSSLDWKELAAAVLLAVVAWYTGKSAEGKKL